MAAKDVPRGTGLHQRAFDHATPGAPFTSPAGRSGSGAWTDPGPDSRAREVTLGDGSSVTYRWYRFVDQPSFQQYRHSPYSWSMEKCEALQSFVEELHRQWPTDRDYMAPPTSGELVRFDPALFVVPPSGKQVGYVPIVTRQESAR